jgi:hypothetical protein
VDDADARAKAEAIARSALYTFLFWAVWLAFPVVIGGVSHGEGVYLASTALAFVVLLHVLRLASKRTRVATSGPLAGLRPAESAEVLKAVSTGRAVGDPSLAGSAVAYAQRRMRLQSIGRVVLPVLIALRLTGLIRHHTPRAAAYLAVTLVPLAVLWGVELVGYRRSAASEERNWHLVAPAGQVVPPR